jgi:hypothetical protein
MPLCSTKTLIQGTWKINSFVLNGKEYKGSLDSLYGLGGKLVITELLKKTDYQIELIWNTCQIQKLRPCFISKEGNVSIVENNKKGFNKGNAKREILCDYTGDYVEFGSCFNPIYNYLLLPKIFELHYANGGKY